MKQNKEIVLMENNQYAISSVDNYLLLHWKKEKSLSIGDFKKGIIQFAGHCRKEQTNKAVINATMLDPNGEAVGWVSGQKGIDAEEMYNAWWIREVVPIYHDAGLNLLSVATGNPNSPGIVSMPVDVNFTVAYLATIEEAADFGS